MPVRKDWQIGDRVVYAGWTCRGSVTGFIELHGKDKVLVVWDDRLDMTIPYNFHVESLILVSRHEVLNVNI